MQDYGHVIDPHKSSENKIHNLILCVCPVKMHLSHYLISSVLLFLTTTCLAPVTEGKNILFYHGVNTYSHRLSVWPLVLALADKGHQVTFFSAHPPKLLAPHENVTEFLPLTKFDKNILHGDLLRVRLTGKEGNSGLHYRWSVYPEVSLRAVQMLLKDREFLDWLETSQFDLIFMDSLYCDFALALSFKFGAPLILWSSTSPYMWQNEAIMGSPVESWIPDFQYAFPEGHGMTFYERIINILRPLYWHFMRRWFYFPALQNLVKSHNVKGMENLPPLEEIEKNTTLTFLNTYFAEEFPRSVPPNVISIGGLQCFSKDVMLDGSRGKIEETAALKKFMDSSQSFIYISFGSAAKVSAMPKRLRKIFFKTMERLEDVKFVLKWETSSIPDDMPKNVFYAPWFSQQEILAHPNIKAFISHGGILGIHEAICYGVPLIILPIFAEQDYNANRLHEKQIAIKLDWATLTQKVFYDAINNILRVARYKRNMMETSRLFLDRPQTALDLAIFWTEFVLKYGNVRQLKPFGIHQSWLERRALDVWLTLFFVLSIFLLILTKLAIFLCAKNNYKQKKVVEQLRTQKHRKHN